MAKDAKKKKDEKKKKHFFKDFKAELKKVIWPTPKQLASKAMAVITIVLITAAIVFVLDLIFDLLNEKGINRLKEEIRNRVVVENTVEDSTDDTDTDTSDEDSTDDADADTSDEDSTDDTDTSEDSTDETETDSEE